MKSENIHLESYYDNTQGNVPENRPMAPPTSNLEQSVIYFDIKAPTDPNKVSYVI